MSFVDILRTALEYGFINEKTYDTILEVIGRLNEVELQNLNEYVDNYLYWVKRLKGQKD